MVWSKIVQQKNHRVASQQWDLASLPGRLALSMAGFPDSKPPSEH
jgi:hypothetical protein